MHKNKHVFRGVHDESFDSFIQLLTAIGTTVAFADNERADANESATDWNLPGLPKVVSYFALSISTLKALILTYYLVYMVLLFKRVKKYYIKVHNVG